MKKTFLSAIIFLFIGYFTFAQRIHDYGNYPSCGFQVNVLGGLGAASNETFDTGFGILGDAAFRFNIKPFNKLYLLEAKDGPEVYVSNIIGLFAFAKLNKTGFDYTDKKTNKTDSLWDTDKMIGGGLHFEIPIITEDSNDTYARSIFVEPAIGYDLNDKQIKLDIFPGINAGTGKMWKYLHFQMQIGFDMRFTLSEDSKDLVTKSYLLVLGCKFIHDFNHSKYFRPIKQLEFEKKAELARQAQREYEQQQAENRRRAAHQQVIDSYKSNYTVFQNYLFPQLFGKSADVVRLKASHPNFVKNSPYGFNNNVYYTFDEKCGEVLQWIDRETCLFNFKEGGYSLYGYSYSKTYTGLAYIHFDSSVTSYPFDKGGVLYVYTGVYNYITAMGAANTIPKFEAVYRVGSLPE